MSDIETIIESVLDPKDLALDITDPVEIFNALQDKILFKAAKSNNLFARRAGKLVAILDRDGNPFINLRLLSKGTSLEFLFPGTATPDVKVFNHWNNDYTSEILNALNTTIKGILNGKDMKDWYKREMGSY